MRVRSAFLYTVLRLLAFLVPFAVLMLFPVFQDGLYWLAAVFAALIGLSLSVLFLRRPRETVAQDLAARRAERREATLAERDADSEDSADEARRDGDA